jgi:hypothetical protein
MRVLVMGQAPSWRQHWNPSDCCCQNNGLRKVVGSQLRYTTQIACQMTNWNHCFCGDYVSFSTVSKMVCFWFFVIVQLLISKTHSFYQPAFLMCLSGVGWCNAALYGLSGLSFLHGYLMRFYDWSAYNGCDHIIIN